jgi:hypothetical protein
LTRCTWTSWTGESTPIFSIRNAATFREQQMQIQRDIHAHQAANASYIEEGIRLLDLAQRAHSLFESQPAKEKRKLLDFVLSNSTWKNGALTAEYRQPFDLLADAGVSVREAAMAAVTIPAQNENWLLR